MEWQWFAAILADQNGKIVVAQIQWRNGSILMSNGDNSDETEICDDYLISVGIREELWYQ